MLHTMPAVRPATTAAAFADPVGALLEELAAILEAIPADRYTARCGEQFFDGAVGGHVRHCLDHVRALADGAMAGCIDYDHRERGTRVEHDPGIALAEARRLRRSLAALGEAPGDLPLRITVMPTRDGRPEVVESTLARELAFVLSHTIHHNAIVKSMAYTLGVSMPLSFGYAPSTLAHQDRCACAR